jgi:uncharacterized protein YlxW (UPF0749 family)
MADDRKTLTKRIASRRAKINRLNANVRHHQMMLDACRRYRIEELAALADDLAARERLKPTDAPAAR